MVPITASELIMTPNSDFLERITVYEVTVEMSKGSRMKGSQQSKNELFSLANQLI